MPATDVPATILQDAQQWLVTDGLRVLLTLVLAEEERQAHQLKALLRTTGERLEAEIRKGDNAEERARTAENRARDATARATARAFPPMARSRVPSAERVTRRWPATASTRLATTASGRSGGLAFITAVTHSGEVPPGEVWVHCAGGYRAGVVAALLDAHGIDVVAIDDSYDNAGPAGLPLRTATKDLQESHA